jgi:hypothetical protein
MPELNESDSAAISAAVSEATSEVNAGSGGVGSGQEVQSEPADTTPEPDAKPDEPDPETFGATADELEAINNDPRLLKVYKSLQRGFTKKTTEISNERKELRSKAEVADWIRSDPDKAIRALAQARGITIAEAKQEARAEVTDQLDELTSQWTKTFGPEVARAMRPVIEATAAAQAKALIEAQLGPVAAATRSLTEAATDRGLSAAIREFGATVSERGEDWDDDVQADMAAVMGRVAPGVDENGQPIPVDEYLDNVHGIVMAQRARKDSLKTQIQRLKAARESEPNSASVSTPERPGDRVTVDMDDNQAVALAVKLARAAAERRR